MQTPMMWIFTVAVPLVFSLRCSGPQPNPAPQPANNKTETAKMDKPESPDNTDTPGNTTSITDTDGKVRKTDSQWRQILTPEQYEVLRKAGTERAYTGIYNDHYEKGIYKCAACGQVLFESDTKYPSHCGWPAFYDVEQKGRVILRPDHSHGMNRTEVLCSRCESHLGHVFGDGPPPTGKRYCINSAALKFEPEEEK